MKIARVGRPKDKQKPARSLVTRRVRRLVDVAHDGNVHEASKVSGLAYATLRDLYSGDSTNPGIRTIQKLSEAYGVLSGWFTDAAQPDEVPLSGWVSSVPGFAGGTSRGTPRVIVIPFAAWPLPSVYIQLGSILETMPASSARPIIGEAQNDEEISLLIGERLLAPILDAERISGKELIVHAESSTPATPEKMEKWIVRMRRLGVFWQEILEDALQPE